MGAIVTVLSYLWILDSILRTVIHAVKGKVFMTILGALGSFSFILIAVWCSNNIWSMR